MVKYIKLFYKSISNYNKWLQNGKIFGMETWVIIFLGFAAINYIFSKIIQNREASNIVISLFILWLMSFFIIAIYKCGGNVLIRFIGKGYTTNEQVLKSFGIKEYIYGLIIFSVYINILIFGIGVSIDAILKRDAVVNYIVVNVYNIQYLIMAVFSFFYFSYHFIYYPDKRNVIKRDLNLYLAVIATFSYGLFTSLELNIKPVLINLAISYAWIQYVFSAVEAEE